MKITLLQRKRNQLAGYCKLVIYGMLDITAATDVFKHYKKVFISLAYLYALLVHTFRPAPSQSSAKKTDICRFMV